ncbi:hypothetical protein [Caballeronia insecticola]|uniref:Uncharacterized protein n=1 Tax=Caballeronia insecticola TaxID=758793 RepID=R4WWV3_9BURK|nr:hypothetical protein [Caballeronia insecticola]BAN22372.1 hypothetical protein BRPE64_ACDS06180 [Caballeronia insecticola]
MADFLTDTAGLNIFSKDATDAAYRGAICSAPFMHSLERVHGVTRGLHELFSLLRNNETQRLNYEDRDDGDDVAPPFSFDSIDNFMPLGAAVCELLQGDIERLARWADMRAESAADEAHAPSVSRRGRKAKDSSAEAEHG